MKHSIIVFILCIACTNLRSQEPAKKAEIGVGADFMSRFVWRGCDFGGSPSIQPHIEFSCNKFSAGTWGAYATNYTGIQEADLYLSYSINDMISFGFTDYYYPDDTASYKYYDYGKNSTGHILEVMATLSGPEKLPLSLLVAGNLYGDNDHSIYVELRYSFTLFDVFAGLTPAAGIYADGFGVVNTGITVKKEIKITDRFHLPIQCSFVTNPKTEHIYLVFGFSL
jgi:hypothetical protein